MNRRNFVLGGLGGLLAAPVLVQNRPQRVIVFLVDGLGAEYISASDMPVLRSWGRKGIVKTVDGVMPSVTNANNASVCCGVWPEEHGITANFFFNEATGEEHYMESADMVLRPTLFEKAAAAGIQSALLSAKKKTVTLLPRGAEVVMAAEIPTSEWVERLGPAPDIYSAEINLWLLKAAIWLLKNRPDLGVLYIHSTDYPMHMWPPEDQRSRDHLSKLDALFGELAETAPDAAILLTADHGMNHKTRCWDLERAIDARGVAIRTAISAEQDKYLKHHRGFGGTAWVHLKTPRDADRVAAIIEKLPGIEAVLSRQEAARKFHQMASRIGEWWCSEIAKRYLGDSTLKWKAFLPSTGATAARRKSDRVDDRGWQPERTHPPGRHKKHREDRNRIDRRGLWGEGRSQQSRRQKFHIARWLEAFP